MDALESGLAAIEGPPRLYNVLHTPYCTYLWSVEDSIVNRQHCSDGQYLLTTFIPVSKQKSTV